MLYAVFISLIDSCPVAVLCFCPRQAIVKEAPNRGDKSLEAFPRSPIAKQMIRVVLPTVEVNFNVVKLSSRS